MFSEFKITAVLGTVEQAPSFPTNDALILVFLAPDYAPVIVNPRSLIVDNLYQIGWYRDHCLGSCNRWNTPRSKRYSVHSV